MKSFFSFVLLTLILLVVALFSALTAMRFAIHGREVAVPDLVGKTPQEGRRISELNGFQFEVERQYYSATIPEGRILLQVPPAGTQIRRGWQIRVAESLGPQRVEIPNLLGQSERAAEFNILRRGLDVGATAQIEMPDVPADQVIAQSPSPSAASIAAPKISLLAAQPPAAQAYVMPSFIGQPVANARLVLQNAGLHVGNVTQLQTAENAAAAGLAGSAPASASQAAGIIAAQNPAPGARVLAGSAVNFELR